MLARARGFVCKHGSALDCLRADALLGERPRCDVTRELEALRLECGAFGPMPAPLFLPPELASAAQGGSGADRAVAASTCAALAVLEELGALRAPVAEPAIGWLARAQGSEGSWDAEPEDARIALTAHVAAYLAKSRRARPALIGAAGSWLAGAFAPERVKGGSYAGLAAFAHFFSNAPHEAGDEVLQWCGRELERGFRTGAFDGLRTARLLALCDAQALPGSRVDAEEAVAALLGEPAGDGGFAGGEDAAGRVAATLAAIHAVRRLAG